MKFSLINDEASSFSSCSSSCSHSLVREEKLSISCDGYMTTGIYTDLIQCSLLLPVIFKHIMFHFSLYPLEERLGYSFRNRALLEVSRQITLREKCHNFLFLLIDLSDTPIIHHLTTEHKSFEPTSNCSWSLWIIETSFPN